MHAHQLQTKKQVFLASNRDKAKEPVAPIKSVTLERQNLPLTIKYDDKTYILVLTRSNKLLLQKPIE